MEQKPPPPFPSPEELKTKIAEFMKSNFGDRVSFATFSGPEAPEPAEPATGREPLRIDQDEFVFDFLPRDIKAHLDRFVIKQDEAKKVLSIAVCDHYNHVNYLRRLEKEDAARAEETEYAKQNVILVGPTGVGKTYLIKHIAELIKVPFVKADATKFSETGYVGGDVEDLVRELVQKADGDVNLAQFGIIYIDEIDKIAAAGNMIGRDVSGRGVQTTAQADGRNGSAGAEHERSAGAIAGGLRISKAGQSETRNDQHAPHSFCGERRVRAGPSSRWHGASPKRAKSGLGLGSAPVMDNELFQHVTTQDFVEYGFEPEFIGRLPVRVVCQEAERRPISTRIIKFPKGGILRDNTKRAFRAYGIEISFEDEALQLIATAAARRKNGRASLLTASSKNSSGIISIIWPGRRKASCASPPSLCGNRGRCS